MKKRIIFLLFFSFRLITAAQQYSVSGIITDVKTGEPLSFANVRVLNSFSGTAANKNGSYELKLPEGKYKIIASFIGYYSDTVEVNLSGNFNLDFKLKQTDIKFPEITVLPGENPALEIIKKAIEKKKERDSKITSYEFEAYTKGVIKTQEELIGTTSGAGIELGVDDTSDTKITGILENQSRGYYNAPDDYKEIIIARKQTSNFPASANILSGGTLIKSFYENNINFFSRDLPGPLNDDALSYYYFYIHSVDAINKNPVYKIYMEPDNPSDPGFTGYIYIKDNSYDLIKVELQINKAANTGGLFDSVYIFQQFDEYDSLFMPVDYRLSFGINYFNLFKFGIELNTILYNYKINPSLNEDLFDKAIITVLPEADNKDSLYWSSAQTIPSTDEEVNAYKRIDSLKNIPKTFWDDFSLLSDRINLSDNFSVSSILSLYHFNRIEGHTLDFGFYLDDALNKRLNSSLNFSYGFSDKYFKKSFFTEYFFGKYRTYNIQFNIYDKLKVLFGESENYNEFTATLLALLSKYEFRDYYYSNGFNIKASGEVFPVLALSVGFKNQTDNNAYVNSDFSFFAKKKEVISNQLINETKINALTAGFKLDFRNYIEDGNYRRRTSLGKSYIIIEGDITLSRENFLKSNLDFTTYELQLSGTINSFSSASAGFNLYGMYNEGILPYQNLYALPGNINLTARNYTFRTLNVNEVLGERIITLNIEHNFRDELFRILNIPGLKDWEIQLNTFFNAAYTDIGHKTGAFIPMNVKNFKNPFYEIGFGIGHILIPMELEFAWKLNHRDGNNFRVGINSFIY